MISSDSGKESFIICRNSQGSVVRATVLRMTRHTVTFEVYNPYSILQNSEVLSDFKIYIGEVLVYTGRGVVSGIVNTGLLLLCEVSLGDSWDDVGIYSPTDFQKNLKEEFSDFLKERERLYKISSEFKVVVADTQILLRDLKRWLEQVEMGIRSNPIGDPTLIENEVISDLMNLIFPSVHSFFDRFEEVTLQVEEPLQPIYRAYTRNQIHPLVLCAPFVYRTFHKPLGYAGDYEMVNMILRNPYEGSSLFAKMVNYYFWSQPPAEAHRNRIVYLTDQLKNETKRVMLQGKTAKIFNLGCGPAKEVQNFLTQSDLCNYANITLVDFNDETLQYTQDILSNFQKEFKRQTQIKMLKKSVHQILKEASKFNEDLPLEGYDFVYCAGLFDYLSDRICKRMMEIFYDLLAPGGLLVATNVNTAYPFKNRLEYMLEWHLIYRNNEQLMNLVPSQAPLGSYSIKSDPTGVNVFIEIRKPTNA